MQRDKASLEIAPEQFKTQAQALAADQVARLAFVPTEIPVGLVTALVGAPMMVYVARRVL